MIGGPGMSQLLKIGAAASATAIVVALGFAFWPQLDRAAGGARAAVEKPVFVVRAAPIKLEAATAPAASQTGPTSTVPMTQPAPAASNNETDVALTKLAMALRANAPAPTRLASATEFGFPRGLSFSATTTPAASDAARRLCGQGLVVLAQGNIVGARAYLERAAEAGDARALLVLGETYDPATLARLGARGIRGDSTRARAYYSQALAAGLNDARERMAALTQ
jgi:TPR repeat protein